ncbi:hypothetical protein EGI22_10415 [Lacihabitans sp. LS3-19]|uniref:hypothetical protein n=1 Tax=Lacihabitans sp. LS3-19 TaxID=2487335 RepID=UPI0020CFBD2F|nr:hypothetical protein [Lacihabitans sp. LS3-19]MCP9768327.1 hypothetical protein [Lacihabitans sp. LS3-19]
MKKSKLILLLFTISVILNSCSKTTDPGLENNVLGVWQGILIEPQFGELITNLTINNTTLNGQSGSGSFKSGDISVCNDNLFNCVPLACTFNLSLLSTSGSSFYELGQILIETNSTCGDGIFEVTIVDENNLSVKWYQEEFPENIGRGNLTRK